MYFMMVSPDSFDALFDPAPRDYATDKPRPVAGQRPFDNSAGEAV
jgi:hypothetical protein